MTTQALDPGFILIHGNRAEELSDIAIKWLQQNPLQALEPEVILVQSSGVAQWLQQQIAAAGIAAALDFVLPASFVWRAYKAVLSDSQIPEKSHLDNDKLVWQILRLMDTDLAYDTTINNFLSSADIRKKYQLAQHLASLYDQYQVYRADWLNQWQQGSNKITDKLGQSIELPASQLWQAELWRLILSDSHDRYGQVLGRAQIHQQFMATLLADDLPNFPALPRRILVFGISTMPKQILESLVALSSCVQVLVFVNNPCEHYWGDIQGQYQFLRSSLRRQQKKPSFPMTVNAEDLHNHVQPLLASWGIQGRDFIAMLDDFDTPYRRAKSATLFARIEQKIDVFNKLPGTNLLQQIQDDIRDLKSVHESKSWPAVDPAIDKSIEFHIAYSKQRELEVLHDQLLDLFSHNPDLKPSDIIVMVPDIGAYAAHIEAVFGQYDINDNRYLPFTIADMGQRNADPLVIALERLLNLPNLRLGAKEILDLLDVPSLRSKFNIRLSDLPLIRSWVEGANIRWGLNQQHKAQFIGADGNNINTWDFGLKRLLLGYAVGAMDMAWRDIYPCAEPGGILAELLGSLANLLDNLNNYHDQLKQELCPANWIEVIDALVDDFFQPSNTKDEATLLRFRQVLHDWSETCNETGFVAKLPSKIVAEYCLSQLDQSFQAPRFFAGSITFATLMPMRAIPFKQVCLLGMQDGDFPRNQTPDDFDLMVLYPRAGDRSRRDDDRYLFLEALLSARDRLYISWLGLSVTDGTEQPPSVLVAQLMDHIASAWQHLCPHLDLLDALTTRHPLQPFSKKYFWQSSDAVAADKYFTYAKEWHSSEPPVLNTSGFVADNIEKTLGLKDMQSFLRDPIRFYYNQTLGAYLNDDATDLNEDESYELDGLAQWQLKNGLLANLESENEVELKKYKQSIIQQGFLPPDNMADFTFEKIAELINPVIDAYMINQHDWPVVVEPLRLCLSLATGQQFNDVITNIWRNHSGEYKKIVVLASDVVAVKKRSDSTYKLRHVAPVWFEHITLNAWFQTTVTELLCPSGRVQFQALGQESARALWDNMWTVFNLGIKQPLAVSPDLSGIYLNAKNADNFDHLYDSIKSAYDELLASNLYLAHAFKDFDDFFNAGDFIRCSEALYGAIGPNIKISEIDNG